MKHRKGSWVERCEEWNRYWGIRRTKELLMKGAVGTFVGVDWVQASEVYTAPGEK